MKLSRILLLVTAGALFTIMVFAEQPAQTTSQQTPPQTPQMTNRTGPPAPAAPSLTLLPQISADHRAEFFKRQVALLQAQQTMTAAQQEFQKAVEELTKDCGERFIPQVGPGGDPVCVPATKPVAAPAAPAAPTVKK